MLVSVIVMAVDGDNNNSITMESSWWRWVLLFFFLLLRLKEEKLEKISIILELGENSGWRGENKEKTLYDLLLTSVRCPLIFVLCQSVNDLRENKCWWLWGSNGKSIRDWMIWLGKRDIIQSWDLPPSFWTCDLIEISLARASIPSVREVLKAPRI